MIKIFGSVLLFFYNICNSYGGAILLFGLLVKLIMLPFQMKSKHSMMRTTMLTPRMKERMNSAFPNAVTYEVKGGGHQCIENRAAELAKVTLDFLGN